MSSLGLGAILLGVGCFTLIIVTLWRALNHARPKYPRSLYDTWPKGEPCNWPDMAHSRTAQQWGDKVTQSDKAAIDDKR